MKTTKRFLMIIALSMMAILRVDAQTPGFEWARNMGGTSETWVYCIAPDPSGNVLIAGYFSGTTDFDPGPGVYNLSSNGRDDIFILKLDVNGNLLWACSMGDTASDACYGMTVDALGCVYVTGLFKGKMDVDPGPGTFFLESQSHATAGFILKLDEGGNFVWAKQVGSNLNSGAALGYSIKVDANGNVIVSGSFIGMIDFDPGVGTYNMTGLGGYDGFIQKLNANGNFIWAKQLAGSGAVYPQSINTDVNGNVYMTGAFVGTNDFNPASKATFNMTANGGTDIFVEKLDANGNFAWAKQMGGTENDYGRSLTLDGTGNMYFTGEFRGTVDFDPGTGIFNLTSNGQPDAFLYKMDVAGNFKWVKQIGGVSWDAGNGLAIDATGDIYVTGYWYGTTDFDPGAGTFYLTTDGSKDDVFIYKSDPAGNMIWVAQMGGADYDYGIEIAVDSFGNIFTAGGFRSQQLDFDPAGSTASILTSSGGLNMFVQKLNPSVIFECPLPSGLYASNVSNTSADLNWSAVQDAYSYNVRYRITESAEWFESEVPAPSTSLALQDLTGETQYEFQVQSVCGEGNLSNFSYSVTFITEGGACYDDYEPNQNMSASAQIPVNTDIYALISPPGDVDWFKFNNTSTNKNIKITLTNLPADYNVALYNSFGSLVNISQNTGLTNEIIIYNTKKAGTFYIKVYGANSGVWDPTHCYTLKASISSANYKSLETEVNNPGETADITVYPNPASTILNISLNSPAGETITLRFTDISGQSIKMINYPVVQGINQITISLDDFRDGLYFIGLTTGSQNYYRKIIIKK